MKERSGERFVLSGAVVFRTPATPVRENLYVSEGFLQAEPFARSARVVDASGAYAVPLMVESAVAQRSGPQRHAHELVSGNRATFALVRSPVSEAQIRRMLVIAPRDLLGVYVSGHLEVINGRPTRLAGVDVADQNTRARWVGTWVDPAHALAQHLMADGRYSETRNGHANAYTGRYWVREDRITYLDDSGFWAFGELLDGTLHHAGFVMRRETTSYGRESVLDRDESPS